MTIKGPNAHNYRGGLGDLLGWGGDSRYDYADDYDIEAHRQYLYQQQQQQHQQQQQYDSDDSSSAGGFANALNNNRPPPRMSYNAPQQTQVQQSSEEAAAENNEKWDKLKKQAINVVFAIVVIIIWLGFGGGVGE